MAKALVVDDEQNLRRVLAAMLKREGYEATVAENGVQALAELRKNGADVVITDQVMPEMDGLSLLKAVLADFPDVPVIMITAHGTVDSAVEAIKLGAFDYITKPFDQEELKTVIAKAARTRDLSKSSVPAPSDEKARLALVGASASMQEVFKILDKVADTPSTVLITGESGTGKELVATALHAGSSRRNKPFIRINCAAIPKDLMESELFGYERGAFTGAVTSKPGRFELADGGTLFLDEIAEIPPEMQVKLLRALQESEFERVGGIKTLKVDVRLIAATNRDLKKEVAEGRFREDLFYRLNVVPIALPPLRERTEDIPALVRHFIDKYNKRLNKKVQGIEPEALEVLQEYGWPGNIRELENLMERMLLFAEGPILLASDLPEPLKSVDTVKVPVLTAAPGGDASMKEIVRQAAAELERDLIGRALEETGGNVTQAAKKLKISRKSLQIKMKEFGLRDPEGGVKAPA
ncbi:MAG: sigma-54-dependent transcriptional regulator [Myxococcales bacterium]|jgi:two-component system response regulator AtoC